MLSTIWSQGPDSLGLHLRRLGARGFHLDKPADDVLSARGDLLVAQCAHDFLMELESMERAPHVQDTDGFLGAPSRMDVYELWPGLMSGELLSPVRAGPDGVYPDGVRVRE